MNIIYGILFLFVVSLVSAFLLYFFVFSPKQPQKAKTSTKTPPPLKSKTLSTTKGVKKNKIGKPPEKVQKPSPPKLEVIPGIGRLSAESQFMVNFARELVKQDADRVIRVIRKWLRER
jgi:flagellar biosynthesis/type III secretory pathway M-ring protein FliF/YscJ